MTAGIDPEVRCAWFGTHSLLVISKLWLLLALSVYSFAARSVSLLRTGPAQIYYFWARLGGRGDGTRGGEYASRGADALNGGASACALQPRGGAGQRGDMGGVLPLRGFRCVWIGGNRVSLGLG